MPKIVDHDERRRVYLEAMWRVVARDGAGAVSHRSVASEAGMSKSNLAYYFPSRADLLAAAVDQMTSEAERRVATAGVVVVDLDSIVDLVMVAIPDSPERRRQSEVWLLLVSERGDDAHLGELLDALDERVISVIAAQLHVLKGSGFIGAGRDIELEAARLHALIDGLSLHTMTNPKVMPPARIREILAAHLADLATPRS